MRQPRVQFTTGGLMAAVAVLTVLFAFPGLLSIVLASVGLGLVVIIPAMIAPPGRRLEAASWASSLQPAVVLFYLYATWAVACCELGHRPRTYLDDPKLMSLAVIVPYTMFAFSMFHGWLICAFTGFVLSIVHYYRRASIGPFLAIPVAWVVGYSLLEWDPLGVHRWFMD